MAIIDEALEALRADPRRPDGWTSQQLADLLGRSNAGVFSALSNDWHAGTHFAQHYVTFTEGTRGRRWSLLHGDALEAEIREALGFDFETLTADHEFTFDEDYWWFSPVAIKGPTGRCFGHHVEIRGLGTQWRWKNYGSIPWRSTLLREIHS